MVEIEAACGGRPALVRLDQGDAELVRRMYDRLSPASLHRRFFSPPPGATRFAGAILRTDAMDRAALAAVEQGEVVGVAQYARRPGDRVAELAVVVADAWQRQGLGTRLIAALADRAVEEGIDAFEVDVQGDNYGAMRLLQRVSPGMRLAISGGVGEGSFAIGGSE